MQNSVYKYIDLVGTSTISWEDAARVALRKASKTLRELRIAEIIKQDIQISNGKIASYRIKIRVSFRVENIEERDYYKDPNAWFIEKEHMSFDG